MRRHISYANVTASLALFVALSTGSYAAVTLRADSVGSRQIRNGQVKRSDIARNAVDASRVQDGSLLARDFKAGQLPAGAAGPQGAKGDAGAKGETGATGTVDTSAFYDKPTSDGRFLAIAGKAADADTLDGVDSTGVLRGAGSPAISSYRRNWADTGGTYRVHDLPGLGTIDFTCADPAAGSLKFTNTSAVAVESVIETVSDAGAVTLTQIATAPTATHTVPMTSPGRVVWQLGPQTYFDPGHLATVTTSQIAQPPIQCRIESQALTQDPVRG